MINYQRVQSILSDVIRQFRAEILVHVHSPEGIKHKVNRDGVDVTTYLDLKIEQQIKTALLNEFPGTNLQGEEGSINNSSSEYLWLIDPIDGTKYFKSGLPGFTCSVGLLQKNEPVFGYVYDFMTDNEYCGAESIRTNRNNAPISVLPATVPYNKVQIAVDRAQQYKGWEQDSAWVSNKLVTIMNTFYRDRSYGLGALACVMVAGGLMNMGGFVSLTGELGTKTVDIAAGRALIKYAGGKEIRCKVDNLSFKSVIISGAPHVVDKIASIIVA